MYRVFRRIAIATGLMLIGAAVVLGMLYRAATAPVPAYQALVERTQQQLESGELDESRQELESQLAALYSDAQQENRWQTLITADQVNGWLATRVEDELPELADQGLFEPRVLFEPGAATLALRAELHGVDTIVTLRLEPFIASDGSLALELSGAKVGSAPLPMGKILNQLESTLGDEALPGRWAQNNGHPVLMLDFELLASSRSQTRSLEVIEVREGELYVAGETRDLAPRVAERTK